MPNIELVPASEVSVEMRAHILNGAYANYYVPTHITSEQMAAMDHYYDIDLGRSVVAEVGGAAVGMALLGVRDLHGWVSGVGVLPEHRHRGVARAMIMALIDAARIAGLRDLKLEVISQNTPAWRLYAEAGFQVTRELLIWRRSGDADALPIPEERLVESGAGTLLAHFDRWHSEPVTWQRDAPTLARLTEAGRLKGYRLDWQKRPAAYCLVSGHGDMLSLMDVGIDPETDISTPGRVLLQALSHLYWGKTMTISNIPAEDPLNRVLAALRFLVTLRQVEMRLEICDQAMGS